jgi:hypothetical protein
MHRNPRAVPSAQAGSNTGSASSSRAGPSAQTSPPATGLEKVYGAGCVGVREEVLIDNKGVSHQVLVITREIEIGKETKEEYYGTVGLPVIKQKTVEEQTKKINPRLEFETIGIAVCGDKFAIVIENKAQRAPSVEEGKSCKAFGLGPEGDKAYRVHYSVKEITLENDRTLEVKTILPHSLIVDTLGNSFNPPLNLVLYLEKYFNDTGYLYKGSLESKGIYKLLREAANVLRTEQLERGLLVGCELNENDYYEIMMSKYLESKKIDPQSSSENQVGGAPREHRAQSDLPLGFASNLSNEVDQNESRVRAASELPYDVARVLNLQWQSSAKQMRDQEALTEEELVVNKLFEVAFKGVSTWLDDPNPHEPQ